MIPAKCPKTRFSSSHVSRDQINLSQNHVIAPNVPSNRNFVGNKQVKYPKGRISSLQDSRVTKSGQSIFSVIKLSVAYLLQKLNNKDISNISQNKVKFTTRLMRSGQSTFIVTKLSVSLNYFSTPKVLTNRILQNLKQLDNWYLFCFCFSDIRRLFSLFSLSLFL